MLLLAPPSSTQPLRACPVPPARGEARATPAAHLRRSPRLPLVAGSPGWRGGGEDWSDSGLDSLSFLRYLTPARCDSAPPSRSFLMSVGNRNGGEGAQGPTDLFWSARVHRWLLPGANMRGDDLRPRTDEPSLYWLSGEWFSEVGEELGAMPYTHEKEDLWILTRDEASMLAKKHGKIVDLIHQLIAINADGITSGKHVAHLMNERAAATKRLL